MVFYCKRQRSARAARTWKFKVKAYCVSCKALQFPAHQTPWKFIMATSSKALCFCSNERVKTWDPRCASFWSLMTGYGKAALWEPNNRIWKSGTVRSYTRPALVWACLAAHCDWGQASHRKGKCRTHLYFSNQFYLPLALTCFELQQVQIKQAPSIHY